MFEADNEGYGIHSYNAMCEDPQCTNAINTEVLSFLSGIKISHSKTYKETVKRLVEQLTKQNFNVRMKESLE